MQQPGEIARRLTQLEIELVHFDSDKKRQPLKILTLVDEVAVLMASNGQSPDSLQAERNQFEQIKTGLSKRAGAIVRACGGSAAFKQQRLQRQPPVNFEWWYLDDTLRASQKKQLRRTLLELAGGIVLAVLLFLLYQRFLAPDPRDIARVEHQNTAVEALQNQQYQLAWDEVSLALLSAPNDVELWVIKGIAALKLGKSAEANHLFLSAQKAAGSMEYFYLVRSQQYLLMEEPLPALEDGQKAIALNPKSAEGYWFKGKAEALLKLYPAARDDFNQAVLLADETNQSEIIVPIKMDLAAVMQIQP